MPPALGEIEIVQLVWPDASLSVHIALDIPEHQTKLIRLKGFPGYNGQLVPKHAGQHPYGLGPVLLLRFTARRQPVHYSPDQTEIVTTRRQPPLQLGRRQLGEHVV